MSVLDERSEVKLINFAVYPFLNFITLVYDQYLIVKEQIIN